MKKAILAATLCAALISTLTTGCGDTAEKAAENPTTETVSTDVTSGTTTGDGITVVTTVAVSADDTTENQKTTQKSEIPAKGSAVTTTEKSNPPAQQQETTKSVQSTTTTEHTTISTTHSKPAEPEKTTEKVTEKPTEKPTVKPPEVTTSGEPVNPAFDINYWISYAKSYAQSIGLKLDRSAVYCWDNPINAGPKCKYIERDIQNRMNRYKKDQDIACVWVWAEETGNGNYNLFVGYA